MITTRSLARLPILFLCVSLLMLGACGQGGKGKKESPAKEPEGPFAGKQMAMKTLVIDTNLTMDEVVAVREAEDFPPYSILKMHFHSYDDQGRAEREMIVTFPQSHASNIPTDGALAYDMQIFYSSKDAVEEDYAVQQIWDFWWDGATGNRSHTTRWEDDIETITYYSKEMPDAEPTTVKNMMTSKVNELGYVIQTTRNPLGDNDPDNAHHEYLIRAEDGITVEEFQDKTQTIRYGHNTLGALESMDIYNADDELIESNLYHYEREGDEYVIYIEITYYDNQGSPVASRTMIEVYEADFCHEASRRRELFNRPNWNICRELSHW